MYASPSFTRPQPLVASPVTRPAAASIVAPMYRRTPNGVLILSSSNRPSQSRVRHLKSMIWASVPLRGCSSTVSLTSLPWKRNGTW